MKPFRSQELVERVTSRLAAVARERTRQGLAARLMQLDAALQATDSVAGILAAVLHYRLASGDAAAAAIGVVDGDYVRFEYAGAIPAELRDRYHVARLDSPLVGTDVIHRGEPMLITDTLDLPRAISTRCRTPPKLFGPVSPNRCATPTDVSSGC